MFEKLEKLNSQQATAPPQISILTPVFNAEAFLAEAIESVLAQNTTASWELLLIDDGSTDKSVAVAQSYQRRFPAQINLLRHFDGGNHGASAARNLGLEQARGGFVAFLDADDAWLPHMLTTQLALLGRFPEAAMVYGGTERTWNMRLPFHADVGPLGDNFLPPLLPLGQRGGLLAPTEPIDWFLRDETMAPCTCSVLVRAAAARAVGGFEEEFAGLYDDQAFYAKIALNYRVAVTNTCVARYRVHASSCCGQGWHDARLRAEARAHFERWMANYKLTNETTLQSELVAAD